MTISFDEARVLVEDTVRKLAASVDDEFVVMRDETIEIGEGWVFFYDSREFVETRDPVSRLAGNGPMFVSRSGVMHSLPSAVSWKVSLARFLKSGDRIG
jgi:hypothetical protein